MQVKDILYEVDVIESLNPISMVGFEGAEVFGSQKRSEVVDCEFKKDLL